MISCICAAADACRLQAIQFDSIDYIPLLLSCICHFLCDETIFTWSYLHSINLTVRCHQCVCSMHICSWYGKIEMKVQHFVFQQWLLIKSKFLACISNFGKFRSKRCQACMHCKKSDIFKNFCYVQFQIIIISINFEMVAEINIFFATQIRILHKVLVRRLSISW